jgi:hypothetical protein
LPRVVALIGKRFGHWYSTAQASRLLCQVGGSLTHEASRPKPVEWTNLFRLVLRELPLAARLARRSWITERVWQQLAGTFSSSSDATKEELDKIIRPSLARRPDAPVAPHYCVASGGRPFTVRLNLHDHNALRLHP